MTFVRLALASMLCTLFSVAAHAAPEKLSVKLAAGAAPKLFAIVYRSAKGVVGEVRLNDMPVTRFTGSGSSGSSNQAQGWLKPGENTIDLVVDKLPTDDKEPIKVSLHGLTGEGFPGDENQLLEVALKQGTATGTHAYSFELPLKVAPPASLWTKAAVQTKLTDADKKEIAAFAQSMLAAMQKGDLAAVKKLWAFTVEERARTTYSDPAEQLKSLDQAAPMMKKTFGTARLAAGLEYRLIGGGRVVSVTTKGGKPPIAVSEKDGEASMPISVAKIDGHWTLVP